MANVILFTDFLPTNAYGTTEDPVYLKFINQPAGAYAIASVLRRNGYSVKVIKYCSNYTFAGIKKIIDDNSNDLLWVGLSTTFFAFKGYGFAEYRKAWHDRTDLYFKNSILEFSTGANYRDWFNVTTELPWGNTEINSIATYVKNAYNVPMLIGGAWVSNISSGNLQNLVPSVHIITGRAETAVIEVTNKLIEDKNSDIPYIVNNDEYDDVSFKNHRFIWTDDDLINKDDWLPIEVSRGCAFNCVYCNYDRKSKFDSYKNPKALREELISNYREFGVTKYILMDDLYNDSKEKVKILYDEVWSKLPFTPEWTSYMRLDMIWSNKDSAKILKDSGARMGSFGIETLHDIAGRKVGKGLGKKRIIETLEFLKKVWGDEVLTSAMFIAGLPDEPEESILETIDWTSKTELLDSIIYSPLWVTPPAHKSFVLKLHQIDTQNDLFGIKWTSDSDWINQQGVTFKRACELAKLGNSTKKGALGSFGHYPEYRRIGWDHKKIVSLKNHSVELINGIRNDTIASSIINKTIENNLKLKS